MLHSRIIDFNTLKLSMYAAELERKLNRALGEPVFFWESRYTQRGNVRPIMFDLNFGYWGLLNAASWVGGIIVLIYEELYVASTALACLWVLLWGPFIRDVISRDAVMSALRHEMAKSPRRKPTPITVPSDSIATHIPVLLLALVAVGFSTFIQFGMDEPDAQWIAAGYNLALVLSLGALDLVRGGPGSIRKSART
jgi:hypothetical protein